MKVRARANGNIEDLPEGHPLIGVYYDPVEEDEAEVEVEKKSPTRQSALQKPEAPVETVAHAEVLTTKSVPAKAPSKPRRRKK